MRIDASSTVLRVIGLCIMTTGVLFVALSLLALMLGRAGWISIIGAAALGFCFALAGWASSEKTVIVVDKRAANLTSTSKCAGWRVDETYPLSDFQRVAMVRDWNRSRHGARKVYRIMIERTGENGDWLCLVESAGSALAARSIASRLARFANLPLRVVDRTSNRAGS